jgi:transposase
MTKPMTLKQFQAKFPTDEACLVHLFETRYGTEPVCLKCGQIDTFHKLAKQPAFTCNCGHHIHPMAGTPFQDTRTPLTTWFLVIFLFCASRNGVSAKEIQRQTGVTYKTAWRMCNLIRQYMGYVDGDAPLGGKGSKAVEADHAFLGGRDKIGQDDKAIVLGMAERGGEVMTRIVPSTKSVDLVHHVTKNVREGATIYTDEAWAFKNLGEYGYAHDTVNHFKKEYVRGPVNTNSIEAFWSHLKRSISGTYISVSKQHLQSYLHEFEFRHNLRKHPHLMLEALLLSFPRA